MIQGELHDIWGNAPGSRRMPQANSGQPLHRIAEVIQQESLKLRTVSRRMQTPLSQVKVQQDAHYNLTLKELYRWQSALQVPLVDLLIDPECSLSAPIRMRANLLKVMKTVRSIQESTNQKSVQRLAKNIVHQLIDMMPELQEVGSWPMVGKRRKNDEPGVIEERRLPDTIFEGSWQKCWEPDVAREQELRRSEP